MKKQKTAVQVVRNVKMVDEVQEVQEVQDLTIVLNDGEREMKGATIPVKWYFSRDLALRGPTYILLVDLTEVEAQEDINFSGRRYLVKVDKAVKFLQMFKSGKHVMVALAFKKLSVAASFLAKGEDHQGFYQEPVYISFAGNNNLWDRQYYYSGMLLASAKIEFTVPQELFAKKPETKVDKLIFNYLYWPNIPKPRDECQVKKLAIFFALPKLPLFLVANLLYAIYLPVASLILLFFGYQSISLAEIYRRILSPAANAYDTDVYVVGHTRTEARVIYENGFETSRETWFSPFQLTGLFSLLGLSLWLFNKSDVNEFFTGFTVLTIFFALLFAFFILRRFFDEDAVGIILAIIFLSYTLVIGIIFLFFRDIPTDDHRVRYLLLYSLELALGAALLIFVLMNVIVSSDWYKRLGSQENLVQINKKRERVYSEYLLENFMMPEKEVGLSNLPDTFETNKFKRDLTIRFWRAKADVCKPYES